MDLRHLLVSVKLQQAHFDGSSVCSFNGQQLPLVVGEGSLKPRKQRFEEINEVVLTELRRLSFILGQLAADTTSRTNFSHAVAPSSFSRGCFHFLRASNAATLAINCSLYA